MELSINEAVSLSMDRGNYPDVIPVDFGNDLILKTKPEIKLRIKNPRKVRIETSTYGVTHYYADIIADGVDLIEETEKGFVMHGGYICEEYSEICKKNIGKYDPRYRIEVLRYLTKEEIEQYPARWIGYNPGDTTNAFYSEKEAFEQAVKIATARFGKGWVLDFETK